MVLSINARLEPRMVAARIHGAACCVQAVEAAPERRAVSSQGVFILRSLSHDSMRRPIETGNLVTEMPHSRERQTYEAGNTRSGGLLQFGVFGFGSSEERQFGIGVFPGG